MTIAVLALQALVQGLVAHSVATRSWWSWEWVRLQLHVAHPTAPFAQHQAPQPGWRDWLPSAATSLLVTTSLVLLALLVARVGRGAWLLAVAALPLVPAELAPGVWGPPLSNQVAYALVWPAGATEPQAAWAWVSAGITAVLVALPAAALAATRDRRPWLSPGLVLGRLTPVGLVAAAWLGWRAYLDAPADALLTGWRTILVVVGALATTGLVRRGQVLLVLAVLPALAAGAVRWTTSVDGAQLLVTDPTAWWMSVAAVGGGVFAAYAQPWLARGLGTTWSAWRGALREDAPAPVGAGEPYKGAPDVAARSQAHVAAVMRLDELADLAALVPDDASELGPLRVRLPDPDGTDADLMEAELSVDPGVSRHRARGASGRSGGRHRA